MLSTALPFRREPTPREIDEELVMSVSNLPFAEVVTVTSHPSTQSSAGQPGSPQLRWTVKSKLASKIPFIVAFSGSATAWTVPVNTLPCANITKSPLESPLCGTTSENIPSEFEAQCLSPGLVGISTPAYTPAKLAVVPG